MSMTDFIRRIFGSSSGEQVQRTQRPDMDAVMRRVDSQIGEAVRRLGER